MITTHDRTPAATLTGQTAMAAALSDFQRRYPAYAGTAVLDDMRARDYARLDATGQVYLDYTGGGLYADSQLARHRDLLAGAVFGNPHSQNLPSRHMTALVEATRAQILQFFRASPEEYEVIFTPNATGALRLVGESFPFGPGGRYLLTFDNHNSVNGIRQFARAKGASVSYIPLVPADLRVSEDALARHLQAGAPVRPRRLARRRSGWPPATCSLSRPSPISPASSTPWPGSPGPRTPGTTYCWTPPPSRRPTGWICPGGTRTTCPCRFTRSSATRPASGPCWYAGRRWPSYTARGTPAARSPSPRYERKLPPARVST